MKTKIKKNLCITALALFAFTKSQAQTNALTGIGAGTSLTTGIENTCNGYYAGNKTTTGAQNCFFGNYAGFNNTEGSDNTFIGSYSGYSSSTNTTNGALIYKISAIKNTFVGSSSGYSNTSGTYNTFVGNGSGYSNTIASENTFIGNSAGSQNTIGRCNLMLGAWTGYYNTTGNFNSFIGEHAGYNNKTGENNLFNGCRSGYKNTTGQNNTFTGYCSGYSNTTGSNNLYLGYKAAYNNATGQQNVIIGNEAGYNLTTANESVFTGYQSGYSTTTGAYNTFSGYLAGYANTTGNFNLCLGVLADVSSGSLTNASAIGYNAKVSASNAMVLGNNANVGIGTSAPAYQLQISTNAAAKAGSATWIVASDQRLKKDIADFTDGLSILEKIHPVWFSYTGEAGMPTNKKFVGVIAQEMKEIAPYTVGKFTSQDTLGNKTEYLDYDANSLFYILVNSVKEQQKNIEEKDSVISTLISANESLNDRLARLEQLIGNNSNTNSTSSIQNISECCDASLEQNYPNPFNENTTIKYIINNDAKNALIVITSLEGREISRYAISSKGNGLITIPANSLSAGTYFYQLEIDGKQVDVKQMEIVK